MPPAVRMPALPQGQNPTRSYIPVARVADMLLNPGAEYDFDGQRRTYPDIRLVYWVGGNPFHHHQDLNRLQEALRAAGDVHRPRAVLDGDGPARRHRAAVDDHAGARRHRRLVGGRRTSSRCSGSLDPFGQARDDYAIFAGLAERLGVGRAVHRGAVAASSGCATCTTGWRSSLPQLGETAPTFEAFWEAGELELPTVADSEGWIGRFRADPAANPLPTPSGKIEIFSETIAGFGYPDCPGHPAWLEPDEWLGGRAAHGGSRCNWSRISRSGGCTASSTSGRPAWRRRSTAASRSGSTRPTPGERGIADGALVKVHNDRGACLAVARVTEAVRPGVVQMATGAWYDPVPLPGEPHEVCVAGNPNMVTRDIGTSRLAQGCTGQLCLVQVSRFEGEPPAGRGYDPPEAPPLTAARREHRLRCRPQDDICGAAPRCPLHRDGRGNRTASLSLSAAAVRVRLVSPYVSVPASEGKAVKSHCHPERPVD